jgi:hypothetical protein
MLSHFARHSRALAGRMRKAAGAAVTAYDVPGDHMNLVREPHAPALAKAMRACLAS